MGENRKEGKQKRKMAISKDSSKHKKTDQEKYLKSVEKDKADKLGKQDWSEGRVLSIMPQGVILDCQGEIFSCVLNPIWSSLISN